MSSPHGYIKRRGIGRRLGEKEEEEKGKEKKDKAFVCTFIAHGLLFNSVRRLTGVQRSRRVGIEWKKKKKKEKVRVLPRKRKSNDHGCSLPRSWFEDRIYSSTEIYLMAARLFRRTNYLC